MDYNYFICNVIGKTRMRLAASGATEAVKRRAMNSSTKYVGWNFNSGNYLFTTDTK
jgi:hypothetical protein